MLRAWQVNTYLSALLWPTSRINVYRLSRSYVKSLSTIDESAQWKPAVFAVVVVSNMLRDLAREACSVSDRERCLERIREDSHDLIGEKVWLSEAMAGKHRGLPSFEYRYYFANGIATQLLLDGKIDIYSKSYMVTAVSHALVELPLVESAGILSEKIKLIGSTPPDTSSR